MSPTFSSGVQSAILALSAILNMAWHCKTLWTCWNMVSILFGSRRSRSLMGNSYCYKQIKTKHCDKVFSNTATLHVVTMIIQLHVIKVHFTLQVVQHSSGCIDNGSLKAHYFGKLEPSKCWIKSYSPKEKSISPGLQYRTSFVCS